ncbi:hypothetical protein PsorP6_001398 [Peronosclerospora sorghi]|uniref:Uncharacterized protein n=1 Tax=Peronosclerospora sorghi TaxID=230839 RepID=A0ACC0WUP7_9STRA|nr:hypothetical protein PsorP6_001398 [Peronosclerospora sorghi]
MIPRCMMSALMTVELTNLSAQSIHVRSVIEHNSKSLSGHYYSILRDQQGIGGKAQWYEFNDTMVTPFDPDQIYEECFGGEESTSAHLGCVNGSLSPKEGSSLPAEMKNRSSFMLFYTRVSSKIRVSNTSAACVSFYSVVLVVAFALV